MSDVEDDPFDSQNAPASDPPPARPAAREEDEEEEEDDDDAPPPRRGAADDDDDDDDDEEDEDEEEEEGGRPKKRRRRKNTGVNRFIDVEAEVDEEDEEEDDDEDFGAEGFIAEPGAEGDEDDMLRASASRFRRDREQEERPEDLSAIAEDYAKRYKQSAPTRYTGDMNDVPQRLLMPSVHDANLWQVRVKPGKEREIVLSLMRKSIDLEFSPRPIEILSVFQRDSLPGMIYVEARSSKQVSLACQGLVGVYPSRGVTLVPIEEMASLLLIKKQDIVITPGSWVRIRRGKYIGDLAQVVDVTENGEEVGLKLIPRIDLNPREENVGPDGKKRKKTLGLTTGGVRPPQRFFNFEEVAKVYKRQSISTRGQTYVFQNETYRDGFMEKDFKVTAVQLDDVNPTLDEITMFSRGQEGTDNANPVDLSIIAEASRKAAIAVLQPGDHVEVFEGEQSGVHGTVHSVAQDIVTITASGVELDGQRIDVPARSVRKRFKAGDHVKVMTGKNADETGLVVAVSDNIVTFLSDMSLQEVSVFSKDLREAAEVGASTNIIGNYELHDLVQLDSQSIGVIFKTERDAFRVLDQNGQVRLVHPHQISMRRDSMRALATDSEGHELRVNDAVREVDGEGRKGRVLHLYQSFFAFLHNRDIAENGGVFVTRVRSLVSQVPKGAIFKPGVDTTKMNPSMAGGAATLPTGNFARGPRDIYQGLDVIIIKGSHKGHIGIIKDTNGPSARVEVSSKNKILTMSMEMLGGRGPDGKPCPLKDALERKNPRGPRGAGGGGGGGGGNPGGSFGMAPPSTFGRTPNPYANNNNGGGATPGWANSGRTPNPYKTPAWSADSRTPAWNASARTPNPYAAGGGKTPAWDASARTPNPYAANGGKTPAWDAGARTPNPYASGGASNGSGVAAGWATPKVAHGASAWGGGASSPARPANGWAENNNAWGGGDSWGGPASAPTPGAATAPTPAAWGTTPGSGLSAQTPAAVGDVDDDYNDDVLDDFWILDLESTAKAGLVVCISGSNNKTPDYPSGFHNGQYEGQTGIVKTVASNMLSSRGSTTVTLNESSTDIYPPPNFLVPVPPENGHEMVMVIKGKYAGQVVKTVTLDAENGKWFVQRENSAYAEVKRTALCRYEAVNV